MSNFRKIEVTEKMKWWAQKQVDKYPVTDENTAHTFDPETKLRARIVEAVHWALHRDRRYVNHRCYDFLKGSVKEEIKADSTNVDPNFIGVKKLFFSMNDHAFKKLLGADVMVQYMISYDLKNVWPVGWIDTAFYESGSYVVTSGEPGRRPGFIYPWTGREIPAIHLNEFPLN